MEGTAGIMEFRLLREVEKMGLVEVDIADGSDDSQR
jgi:hypothetical protein